MHPDIVPAGRDKLHPSRKASGWSKDNCSDEPRRRFLLRTEPSQNKDACPPGRGLYDSQHRPEVDSNGRRISSNSLQTCFFALPYLSPPIALAWMADASSLPGKTGGENQEMDRCRFVLK